MTVTARARSRVDLLFIAAAWASGSRRSLEEGCEGVLFVEELPGLEAVDVGASV